MFIDFMIVTGATILVFQSWMKSTSTCHRWLVLVDFITIKELWRGTIFLSHEEHNNEKSSFL